MLVGLQVCGISALFYIFKTMLVILFLRPFAVLAILYLTFLGTESTQKVGCFIATNYYPQGQHFIKTHGSFLLFFCTYSLPGLLRMSTENSVQNKSSQLSKG